MTSDLAPVLRVNATDLFRRAETAYQTKDYKACGLLAQGLRAPALEPLFRSDEEINRARLDLAQRLAWSPAEKQQAALLGFAVLEAACAQSEELQLSCSAFLLNCVDDLRETNLFTAIKLEVGLATFAPADGFVFAASAERLVRDSAKFAPRELAPMMKHFRHLYRKATPGSRAQARLGDGLLRLHPWAEDRGFWADILSNAALIAATPRAPGHPNDDALALLDSGLQKAVAHSPAQTESIALVLRRVFDKAPEVTETLNAFMAARVGPPRPDWKPAPLAIKKHIT